MESEAEKTFHLFAAFGDSSSSGSNLNNQNFVKLCKDCGIIDGKAITPTDVDIVFSKVKDKNVRSIDWSRFQSAIKELGQKKFIGKSPEEALQNMFALMKNKGPVASGVTKVMAVGGVDRLTDPSKYTGSHKDRFDEVGKGKGKAGREDMNTGYVNGYKGAGTYDKKKK